MSDYQLTDVIGKRWKRACRVLIDNPLDGQPTITFAEEEVVSLDDDQTVTRLVDSISSPFDPDEVIPVRNPLTWELTGESITAGQLYALLASAYWKKALERDAEATE